MQHRESSKRDDRQHTAPANTKIETCNSARLVSHSTHIFVPPHGHVQLQQ